MMSVGMERFQEKSRLIEVVLRCLAGRPHRREELLKRVLQQCGSTAKFSSVFAWLKASGFIAKTGVKHRAPYTLTGKGRRYLAALTESEPESEEGV